MKLFALFSLAVAVQALPGGWGGWSGCLSDADAHALVAGSIVFLEHKDAAQAKQTAYQIFAPDIVEFGDSINALRQDPLGTQVENGITQYTTETLAAPGVPQINTLDIVHDCSQVVWHWEFIGIGPGRIRGFTLMKVNAQGKIQRQDVEFNSLTWATDIGFTVTPPTSGPFAGNG